MMNGGVSPRIVVLRMMRRDTTAATIPIRYIE